MDSYHIKGVDGVLVKPILLCGVLTSHAELRGQDQEDVPHVRRSRSSFVVMCSVLSVNGCEIAYDCQTGCHRQNCEQMMCVVSLCCKHLIQNSGEDHQRTPQEHEGGGVDLAEGGVLKDTTCQIEHRRNRKQKTVEFFLTFLLRQTPCALHRFLVLYQE